VRLSEELGTRRVKRYVIHDRKTVKVYHVTMYEKWLLGISTTVWPGIG
jgi:hypothetical protein